MLSDMKMLKTLVHFFSMSYPDHKNNNLCNMNFIDYSVITHT